MDKTRNRHALSSLRLFARDFGNYAGWRGAQAGLLVFIGVFVDGVGLILLVPFIAVILGEAGDEGRLQQLADEIFTATGADTQSERILLLLGCFGVLLLLRAVVVVTRDIFLTRLEVGFVQSVRSRIAHRLASARWDVISRLRHARVAHLMSGDIQRLSSATNIIIRDTVAVTMLASQIVIAFILAPLLALFALLMMLLGLTVLPYLLRHARRFGGEVAEVNLVLIDNMVQFLGGLKLSIGQNLQSRFTSQFDAGLEALSQKRIRYTREQTMIRTALATLTALAGGAAVFVGAVLLALPPETLIATLLVLTRMNGPATQLQLDAQSFAHVLPVYERVTDLEKDLVSSQGSQTAPARPLPADSGISFKGVSFLHRHGEESEGQEGGIRDITLDIPAGSLVGIAGPSGAGKTTFADLLVGLFPPQAGEIAIGGETRDEGMIAAWRDAVSYVAQDPFLFHDTIRKNLLWGAEDAGEAELWQAMDLVGASALVRRLPQGLDTVVGERGTLLSGGERQRLNLARALLRRPRFLVLDEASNAIDEQGERELYERLAAFAPGMTIVVIAHRLEALRPFPRLILFEGGRIAADGVPGLLIDGLRARTL